MPFDHGQEVGRVITRQTADEVCKIASKTAHRLFGVFCRSSGQGEELDQAIRILRDVVRVGDNATNASEPVDTLLCQGDYLCERLYRQGRKLDADQAVDVYHEVLRRNPSNLKATIQLSWVLQQQYERTGQRWMLDEAIRRFEEAIIESTQTEALFHRALLFAAISLRDRSEVDASIDDLDISIELLRLLASLSLSSDDSIVKTWTTLADALTLRYRINGEIEDAAEAESFVRWAETVAISATATLMCMLVRADLLRARYSMYKQSKDILASSLSYTGALILLSGNAEYPQHIFNLVVLRVAWTLKELYDGHNDPDALAAAYGLASNMFQAPKASCLDWQSDHQMIEAHELMGSIQQSRYLLVATVDIADDAINHLRQCVRLTPIRDAKFGVRVARLSGSLRTQMEQGMTFRKLVARNEAIYWMGKLVHARRPFLPADRSTILQEVGDLLQDLHQGNVTVDILERAITFYTSAMNTKKSDFSSLVGEWRRAGEALIDKGNFEERTVQLPLYEAAQSYLDKIATLSAETKCFATSVLPLQARIHECKYNCTGATEHATQALETLYEIFHDSGYTTETKSTSALKYLVLVCSIRLKKDTASETLLQELECSPLLPARFDIATTEAIELILRKVSFGLDRRQQLYALRKYAQLAIVSVWLFKFWEKSAFQIVRIYERARSILWNRLVNSTTQLKQLEEHHKDLAERYCDLYEQVTTKLSKHDSFLNPLVRNRPHIALELDNVVAEIRSKKGFEDFLQLPLSQEEMQDFACDGPIVYLVSGLGSNLGFALTISSESIALVDLPGYSNMKCQEQFDKLQNVLVSREGAAQQNDQVLRGVFTWLWYKAVKPVLEALRLLRSERQDGTLPRLWWVTNDWVNRLPIHAAGDYESSEAMDKPRCLMDHVVSSYTPTLRALEFSRKRFNELQNRANTVSERANALLVAMKNTPDRAQLKHAEPEATLLETILKPRYECTLLRDPQAYRRDVIQNLRQCTIAHMACHGEADHIDPLRSKLLLQDWGPKPLRVGFLMRMGMSECQLAYLSACQTAVNKAQELNDEGLHISGAFQMAGVPNVIATSWNILDREALVVTEGFYQGLKDTNGDFDLARCASSLNATIRSLRDAGVCPYVWGSYAHYGV